MRTRKASSWLKLYQVSETCGHTLDTGAGWVCREWVESRCGAVAPQEALSLSHRDAPFQQEGSNLIDDASALADQPLTDAMQSLQVELIGGLGDHKLHRRPLYRLGNRLGVTGVCGFFFGLWNRVARTSPASAVHRALTP